jgi:hypothetical protein
VHLDKLPERSIHAGQMEQSGKPLQRASGGMGGVGGKEKRGRGCGEHKGREEAGAGRALLEL